MKVGHGESAWVHRLAKLYGLKCCSQGGGKKQTIMVPASCRPTTFLYRPIAPSRSHAALAAPPLAALPCSASPPCLAVLSGACTLQPTVPRWRALPRPGGVDPQHSAGGCGGGGEAGGEPGRLGRPGRPAGQAAARHTARWRAAAAPAPPQHGQRRPRRRAPLPRPAPLRPPSPTCLQPPTGVHL